MPQSIPKGLIREHVRTALDARDARIERLSASPPSSSLPRSDRPSCTSEPRNLLYNEPHVLIVLVTYQTYVSTIFAAAYHTPLSYGIFRRNVKKS